MDRQLPSLIKRAIADTRSDAELLASVQDEHAAFAELVNRHGPLVWGVCRNLLGEADADDAFQATFLALFRSADRLRDGAALASWLHGVAVRVSRATHREADRRRSRERVAASPESMPTPQPDDWEHTMSAVHQEVAALPQVDRSAFILNVLEGLTQAETAVRLGRTPGVVAGQVARAKKRLVARLTRRGVVPGLVAIGTTSVAGAVPPGLVERVLALADNAAGKFLATAISPNVAALTEGAMKAMLLNKLTRELAVVLAMVVTAGVGVGIVSHGPASHFADGPENKPFDPPPARPAEPGAKALSKGQEPKTKTADKVLSKEDKDELASRLWSLRHPHIYESNDRYNLIGNLVENGWWKSQLPLSPAQASVIMKLDALIRDAGDNTRNMIADSLEKNPIGFRETLARFNDRLHESIRRGQRLVALGLLTESQAADVLYSYTSDSNHLYVLRDPNIQELLGMTAAQDKELDKVGDAANRREAQLNLWTVDPIEQEYVGTVMAANAKRMNAEALKVLTPAQRKIWDAFTARRTLAAKAPDMPAPTKDEMGPIKISEKSAIFRMLAEKENTLKLTEAQKKLVNRLEEVAQTGLHWIGLRKPESAAAVERVSKVSAEFIQHAEQLVLCSILTEQQAEQIKSAIAKADSGTKPKN